MCEDVYNHKFNNFNQSICVSTKFALYNFNMLKSLSIYTIYSKHLV